MHLTIISRLQLRNSDEAQETFIGREIVEDGMKLVVQLTRNTKLHFIYPRDVYYKQNIPQAGGSFIIFGSRLLGTQSVGSPESCSGNCLVDVELGPIGGPLGRGFYLVAGGL